MPPSAPEHPLSQPRRLFAVLAITALFAALGLWAHRPVLLHWTTAVFGDPEPGDSDVFAWNLWWVRQALSRPDLDLFHCPLVFFPFGFDFLLHSHALAYSLLGAALGSLGLGIASTLNALVLLGFTLTGLGMVLFTRALGLAWPASLLSGLALTLWPFHVGSISHFSYSAIEWIPWTLWATTVALRTGHRRWAVLAGLLLGSALWQDYYICVFTVMFWGLFVAEAAAARWRTRVEWRRGLLLVGISAISATIVAFWPLVEMISILRGEGYVAYGGHNQLVADILAVSLPSPHHPLWGRRIGRVLAARDLGGFPQSLGYTTFALGLVAAFSPRVRRVAWAWWGAWGFFLLLALGEYVHVAGHWRFGAGRFALPLPYHLLKMFPPFDNLRAPIRFLICVAVCQVVLAGLGAEALLGHTRRLALRRAMAVGLPLLVLFEYLPSGQFWHPLFDNARVSAPLARQIAAEANAGTVAELPIRFEHDRVASIHQMLHGHPIFAGFVARLPLWPYYGALPGLGPLSEFPLPRHEPSMDPNLLDDDHWRRFQWLFNLTHLMLRPGWGVDRMNLLPRAWGAEVIGRDREFALLRLTPPAPASFDLDLREPAHLIFFPQGFGPPDGEGMPLVARHGLILLRGAPGATHRVTLELWSHSWRREDLAITVNGHPLAPLETVRRERTRESFTVPTEWAGPDAYLWIRLQHLGLEGLVRPPRVEFTRLALECLASPES
jgi:hypothetical protein